MKVRIKHGIVCTVLAFVLPLSVQGQEFERISLGGKVVVWSVPDLDGFWVALDDLRGTERHEIDDNVLYGVRPFLRVGLVRQLALELSHEFAFGDNADIMVTSGTGIWRPFSSSGLELHASICYGQLDWDGPGNFDSTWGWEAGGGYSFKLFDSVNLVLGVAYRDLSFDYEVEELLLDLVETRPDVTTVRYSRDSVDPSGLVADIGIFVTF